jgi:serine/threonine protein kinase
LAKLPAPEIRNELNAYASLVLEETNQLTVKQFEEFATQYSEAIYRAWYVDLNENSRLLSYSLVEKQAEGAFGSVYRAVDDTGENFAVKILHERIRNNSEMLQSFRRGIRSMRILAEAKLPGVVEYFDASEIPAMVVMEFIEGINLSEAVEKRVLTEWPRLLRVATELTNIIRASHKLPQRVLHRDIRPANVMLQHCWGPNPDWEEVKIRVLDFDLSYHLDAFDISISQPGNANGYLAPEQADRTMGVSTRNAAVDSFGLGMTLFHLRTGIEPRFAEHRYANWKATLEGHARQNPCNIWHSLPRRFFRIVFRATIDNQEHRIDMAGIQSELTRLCEALREPVGVRSAELLAEELASRAFGEYKWDPDRIAAVRDTSGFKVRIVGDESALEVIFEFEWLSTDNSQYDAIRKWLPRARENTEAILRKSGWKPHVTMNTGQLRGRATISVDELRVNIAKHGVAIEEVMGALSLS